MRKILFIVLLPIVVICAKDVSMEIVKKKNNIPNVYINTITKDAATISEHIKKMVQRDLLISSHFLNKEIDYKVEFENSPNYTTLEKKGVQLYLNLKINKKDKNGISVNMKLFDTNAQELVASNSFQIKNEAKYPFLSHKIAILINKLYNAPPIDWMDRYIIFAKYNKAKNASIVISDYTLTYQKTIVAGGLNIFPKWANKYQSSFYYTKFFDNKLVLMKKNIYTGENTKIVSSNGMLVCSDVSKDGNKLALTMAPNGQPDVYVYNIKTKKRKRVTFYSGIDVGAGFVEDDTKVVFVSNRLRHPNIFSKKIQGSAVKRLVYHSKNNSAVTTYKNYIAYSSKETSKEFGNYSFNIYLISTTNSFISRLTAKGVNQFPRFSIDGETLLFIKKRAGKSYLGISRLNYNKSYTFPLKSGKLQSIDW
ncbi:MAG: Tol-Pal system protein TolB [Epsilonproteobacteria bacterium]|nr:MAG: Tol-Pal system protein TolB [Campylobacterota bacterium]